MNTLNQRLTILESFSGTGTGLKKLTPYGVVTASSPGSVGQQFSTAICIQI